MENVPYLLRIDASSRTTGSVTRRLADAVERRWCAAHSNGFVLRRDLALAPIAHVRQETITGFYTAPSDFTPELREATALSDALIGELKSAHTLLIASPIYNFSLPSALKAWVDHIMRIGHTFSYEGGQFNGLVKGPRAVLALAYGAGGYQAALAEMDHLRPYLTQLLKFVGITDVTTVTAEATTTSEAEAEVAKALKAAASLWTTPTT